MVLVYEEEELGVLTEAEMAKRERRKIFKENLEKEGLEFELEDKQVRNATMRGDRKLRNNAAKSKS